MLQATGVLSMLLLRAHRGASHLTSSAAVAGVLLRTRVLHRLHSFTVDLIVECILIWCCAAAGMKSGCCGSRCSLASARDSDLLVRHMARSGCSAGLCHCKATAAT
jgi:hypothetical protein